MTSKATVFVLILALVSFGTVFSQPFHVGIHAGGMVVQDLDTYTEMLIPGPWDFYISDYATTGYLFYPNSFESTANIQLGASVEYQVFNWLSPFIKFSYFSVNSTGDCNVNAIYSGGLAERDTRFEIKTNLYNATIGARFCYPINGSVPFVSVHVIYNRTSHQDLELLDVSDDFRKYAFVYSFDPANNIGLGFGVGVKIPISEKFVLAPAVEYESLGMISSDTDEALVYYHYSLGLLYRL